MCKNDYSALMRREGAVIFPRESLSCTPSSLSWWKPASACPARLILTLPPPLAVCLQKSSPFPPFFPASLINRDTFFSNPEAQHILPAPGHLMIQHKLFMTHFSMHAMPLISLKRNKKLPCFDNWSIVIHTSQYRTGPLEHMQGTNLYASMCAG